SNAGQLRVACPVPLYTTRSSGRSATSGSRLFMSMRSVASCCQPLQLSTVLCGVRITCALDSPVAGLACVEVIRILSKRAESAALNRRRQELDIGRQNTIASERGHQPPNGGVLVGDTPT